MLDALQDSGFWTGLAVAVPFSVLSNLITESPTWSAREEQQTFALRDQEGVRPYIRAGVAVILLPMMAIRGQGSYLRDVLEVQAIHRITPGSA